MAKAIDLTRIKKQIWKITLHDSTEVTVKTPTKSVMDKLIEVKELFETSGDDESEQENLTNLYIILAEALSNNQEKKELSTEYLSKELDLEDVMLLFNGYMEFVSENVISKN